MLLITNNCLVAAVLLQVLGTVLRTLIVQGFHRLWIAISVVEPDPQGAGTFGWSRSWNIEVSAPVLGQLK
jgi:hypothetical protein